MFTLMRWVGKELIEIVVAVVAFSTLPIHHLIVVFMEVILPLNGFN